MWAMWILALFACSTPAPPAVDPARPPELYEVSEDVPTPTEWQSGPEVYQAAVAAGQPTLVYFSTDWCHYCKNLDRQVLHDPRVDAALTGVVRVRVNPESSTPASDLYHHFRGTYVPLIYLVTDHGDGTDKVATPDNVDAPGFVKELERVFEVACARGAEDVCGRARG